MMTTSLWVLVTGWRKLQDGVEQEVDGGVEYDEAVRQALDVDQPSRPLLAGIVEGLVDCRDEPPSVAEDEEPDDGQRDSGDPAFTAAKHGASGFGLEWIQTAWWTVWPDSAKFRHFGNF